MKQHFVSWEDVQRASMILMSRLQEVSFVPDVVVGVARGGLVPAALIAHSFGVWHVETLAAAAYDDRKRREHVTISARFRPDGLTRYLIVDDLVHSGATFNAVRRTFGGKPTATYAALFSKSGDLHVDYVAEYISSDVWLVFPWELNNASEAA